MDDDSGDANAAAVAPVASAAAVASDDDADWRSKAAAFASSAAKASGGKRPSPIVNDSMRLYSSTMNIICVLIVKGCGWASRRLV